MAGSSLSSTSFRNGKRPDRREFVTVSTGRKSWLLYLILTPYLVNMSLCEDLPLQIMNTAMEGYSLIRGLNNVMPAE
jgi:uncharacterized protein with PQ loop repeat